MTAIFISGTGSNLQAILDANFLPRPAVVISSNPSAAGLGRARRMGIPTIVLSNPIDWEGLQKSLENCRVRKIFLLGFMKVIPAKFLKNWENKILNLHPSLLPLFPGLKAFDKAFHSKAPLGATVHVVNEGVDEGPIVRQKKFQHLGSYNMTRIKLSFVEQSLVMDAYAKGS